MKATGGDSASQEPNFRTVAFVDHGFTSQIAFLRAFFNCGEFSTPVLKKLLEGRRLISQEKHGLAGQLAEAVEAGEVSAQKVLLAFVKQPRPWLAFKVGRGDFKVPDDAHDPEILLREFGKEAWYGPIQDPANKLVTPFWYVSTLRIKILNTSNIRWHVIAEVGSDYIALSWLGFGYDTTEKRHEYFPFWQHVPQLFEEAQELVDGTWKAPSLHMLILTDLWKEFAYNDDYEWTHRRVRAESQGIIFHAQSGVTEFSGSGLQKLSQKIATETFKVQKRPTNTPEYTEVERAILRTFIREWGTKSYEFQLDAKVGDKLEPQFHGHVYFGTGRARPPTKKGEARPPGQDTLQHINCYAKYGNSRGALDFLIRELRRRSRIT